MTDNRTRLRGMALVAAVTLTVAGAAFAEDSTMPSGTSPNGSANPTLREGPIDPSVPTTPAVPIDPEHADTAQRPSADAGKGVIPPPPTGDKNVLPPPDGGASRTPVIPPPGSPGGNPNVQPK